MIEKDVDSDNREKWLEHLIEERNRLKKRRWARKKLRLETQRVEAFANLGEFEHFVEDSPDPINEQAAQEILFGHESEYYERMMGVVSIDFQIAFFGSKWDPEIYLKFIEDFQLISSHLSEYMKGLGLEENLDFFIKAGKKIRVLPQDFD